MSENKFIMINHSQDNGKPLLEARQLYKRYKNASSYALKDFHLSVRSGEIVGLLGPNGAGKTTAISIMSSLMPPDKGTVWMDGVDMYVHPDRARRLFGLAPQELALYPELTARENMAYFGRLYGLRGKRLTDRVNQCLALAGLENKANLRIAAFSGGMKRRANLAVAVLHQPRLLFLDEPTVGIDAQSRNLIMEKLLELRDAGVGMIYTTHYMEEAETLCTRVAVIDRGRIIREGTQEKLLEDNAGCTNLGDLFLALTGRQLRDG